MSGAVIPLSIPAGAIVLAPPPALVGEANAAHLGMTGADLATVLGEMARDPVHAARVVVLSRRPRRLAAAPDDVLRYLRLARSAVMLHAQPAAEPDPSDGVLEEMSLAPRPRR